MQKTHHITFAVQPVAPETDGAPLRFSGIAYSGGVIPAFGWHGDVAIDLASLKNDGVTVPVLADRINSIDAVAGLGTIRMSLDNALTISGEIIESCEAGRTVASLPCANFPVQISVSWRQAIVKLSSASRRLFGEGSKDTVKTENSNHPVSYSHLTTTPAPAHPD